MQYPQSGLFCSGARWLAWPVLMLMLLLVSGCEKIELERADGTLANWNKYRGQWVLVNYWAEWCKPCLEEIPELNELDNPDLSREALIRAMANTPKLIERPIVLANGKAAVGRPPENVLDIL